MAKKNVELNQAPAKNIDEMSDVEFITSADYLASPYYRAYMSAKARVGTYSEGFQPLANTYGQNTRNSASATVKGGYSKKRGFFLLLIALFMLVVIAVGVLNVFNIELIDDYVATFIKPGVTEENNINIGLLDPIYGVIKKFAKLNLDSVYFDSYLSNIPAEANILTVISLYAVPAAAFLILLCALIGFIKAISALFAKKGGNNVYKKYKFGFLSIIMFLCGIILLVGGVFASGLEIKQILDFILQKTTVLNAGYGLYALIALPILNLIFSCLSYKKAK